jgi:hypothetical protein
LGDLPDLDGSVMGTGTVSLRVEKVSETVAMWNDERVYALRWVVPLSTTAYVQESGGASGAPDDPPLSCAGLAGTRTLWYRPLFSSTAILEVQVRGAVTPVLALWMEGDGGLRELGCVVGDGAVLREVLPAGRRALLEVATLGDGVGPVSLVAQKHPAWAIYLPVVVSRYEY